MDHSKLIFYYLSAHYHENTCDGVCVIANLLKAGADPNSPGCLITPLQIAVRNWDYTGVKTLLGYGADPNSVGQLGGYIPTHIDAMWTRSSPLHILRNAEYGPMAIESLTFLKVCFQPWFCHFFPLRSSALPPSVKCHGTYTCIQNIVYSLLHRTTHH
jgi:hypothetical protein